VTDIKNILEITSRWWCKYFMLYVCDCACCVYCNTVFLLFFYFFIFIFIFF